MHNSFFPLRLTNNPHTQKIEDTTKIKINETENIFFLLKISSKKSQKTRRKKQKPHYHPQNNKKEADITLIDSSESFAPLANRKPNKNIVVRKQNTK